MGTRNGLTGELRKHLAKHGASTVPELFAAMQTLGLADDARNVRSILNQRSSIGEFKRGERDGMTTFKLDPDFVHSGRGESARVREQFAAMPVLADKSTPAIGGFGLTCQAPQAPAGCKALDSNNSVQAAIADCLNADVGQTLSEIVELLDGECSKSEIVAALGEMVLSGAAIPAPAEHGGTFYTSPMEAAPEETRVASQHAVAETRSARLGPGEGGQPHHESGAASIGIDTLGFRARLEAIANDLDGALQDACDALLPHSVIKALVQAQSGAQRALRQVEA